VKVVWLAHTGNPGAVRNAAVQESRGRYVAFLDSDDLWAATKLERQIAGLRSRRACRWSYTGCALINAAGEQQPHGTERQWVAYRGRIFERLLANEPEIWTPAVLVERELLLDVGGFDEQLTLFEDHDLWLRLAYRSEVDVVDEPLIRVRLHDHDYGDGGIAMLASRHRSLGKLRQLVPDTRLNGMVGRLYAQCTLELAKVRATVDRISAAVLVMTGCAHAWRYPEWWSGLPSVLLRLAAPRSSGLLLEERRRQAD
jgi:glycosyltransferase involved in cell wall biosynthesis